MLRFVNRCRHRGLLQFRKHPPPRFVGDELLGTGVVVGFGGEGRELFRWREAELLAAFAGEGGELLGGGFGEIYGEVESAPEGVVERAREVAGGNDEALGRGVFEFLHECDNDAVYLANFHRRAAPFRERIYFVEEQYARILRREAKHFAQPQRGLPEIRADECIEPHEIHGQSDELPERGGGGAFSAAGRAVKKQPPAARNALRLQLGAVLPLVGKFRDICAECGAKFERLKRRCS